MYLRITNRTNKDGSAVEYFQLAHNERHPDTRKPVAKIGFRPRRLSSATVKGDAGTFFVTILEKPRGRPNTGR